mmetsp:Transcript_7213/g.13677  ORF Transcript_7213/g.13677 Transcript_7213/m.13677 type:complete len:514 (+) Transcript_7213:43-1584(+)
MFYNILIVCLLLPIEILGDFSEVVTLTEDNFDEIVTHSNDSWLLEFYAPWCGHCKKLAPIFEDAAVALAGRISYGKIDCTEHKALQKRFEIKSYPSIKFYRDGETRSYRGLRSLEALVQFGKAMLAPSVTTVTLKSVNAVIRENAVTLIYFGTSANAKRVFEKVAYRLQGTVKFVVPDSKKMQLGDKAYKKLAAKFGLKEIEKNHPAVAAVSYGAQTVVYKGPFSTTDFRNWVLNHSLPLVSQLSPENFEQITEKGKFTVFALTDPGDIRTEKWLEYFYQVANDFRSELTFANIDGVRFKHWIGQFGYKDLGQLPGIFALDYQNEEYFVDNSISYSQPEGDDAVDTEAKLKMSVFLSDLLAGHLLPRGTAPWYSPVRLFKLFETRIGKLTETQLILGFVCAMLLFVVIIVSGCSWVVGVEDEAGRRDWEVSSSSGGGGMLVGNDRGGPGVGSGHVAGITSIGTYNSSCAVPSSSRSRGKGMLKSSGIVEMSVEEFNSCRREAERQKLKQIKDD